MHINIHQSLISFLIHPSMTQKWLPKWLQRWPQSRFKMAQSGSQNGSWNHKKPLPILKKSLPKRLPIPIFRDREWDSGVTKVTPDFWKSHSRNGSRNGFRHGSRIIGIGSEKSGVRNLEISLSRIGIEESGVTWKKPLPNPLPIPIGSQNFAAHWARVNL